jgi:pentatricopeptide repeat protein
MADNTPDLISLTYPSTAQYAEEKNSAGAQELFSTMVLRGRPEVSRDKILKVGSYKKTGKKNFNKDVAKCLKMSPPIHNTGINLKSCNLLLKAYGRSGDLLNASKFFDSMGPEHGLDPDSFSWSMLIQAAINSEELPEAVATLDKWLAALKSGMTIGSVSHNHIFNLLITAFLKKRDHKTVEELYQRMLLNDIQPNGHTYTSLVSSALESNRRVLANTYFLKMVEEKVPINHFLWRVLTSPLGRTLDHRGYGSMITYIRKSGSIPTVGMWRDLVGIYGKLGMCSLAEKAMKDMVEVDKIAPDRGCYVRLIRTYCEFEKDWEKGLMLLRELRDLKMEPSSTAWTYVIEACVFSRQWRKRERDKRQMDMGDEGSLRARKIKKESNINIVFSLIEEMQKVDKIIPDSFLWGTVVNAFSKRISVPAHDSEDRNSSDSYSSSSVKYENDSDTYFTYFFNNGGKYRVTDEVALLQRFLSLCNEKNRENLFSEILRPLLLASLSVGKSHHPQHLLVVVGQPQLSFLSCPCSLVLFHFTTNALRVVL